MLAAAFFLKLGQKLQLEGRGHDVHVWKKMLQVHSELFFTELCNILLCYIKIPVRDLNFVSLTIIKECTS